MLSLHYCILSRIDRLNKYLHSKYHNFLFKLWHLPEFSAEEAFEPVTLFYHDYPNSTKTVEKNLRLVTENGHLKKLLKPSANASEGFKFTDRYLDVVIF